MVADAYAKVALWRKIERNLPTPKMTQISKALAAISISFSGKKTIIASNLKKGLTHHIAQQQLIRYWKRHEKQSLMKTLIWKYLVTLLGMYHSINTAGSPSGHAEFVG